MTIHNAPPVAYPLGRSYFLGRALLGLWLVGVLLCLMWLSSLQRLDWRMGLAFAAVLVSGLAARACWRPPVGQWVWDGQDWRIESAHGASELAGQHMFVIADFQSILLLRLQDPKGISRWLCLERRAMPERWLDVRRAVYAVRRNPAGARWHDAQAASSQPAALAGQGHVHE